MAADLAIVHCNPRGTPRSPRMSRQCDTEKAYVFFGDRVREDDFAVDPAYGRAFALPNDADWLTRLCSPLRVEVRR